jgi:hypothetical protein
MSFIRGYSRSVAAAYGVATFQPATRPVKSIRNRNKNSIMRKMFRVHVAAAASIRFLFNGSEQNDTDSYLEDRALIDAEADSGRSAALAA